MISTSVPSGLTDHSRRKGHVLLDKYCLVKSDGDIFECAKGHYYSLRDEGRKYACTRVKAHQRDDIAYEKLKTLAKTGAFEALELLCKEVERACSPGLGIIQCQASDASSKTVRNRKLGER